ncbi:MAG: cobalt ECF transporter T component CbiQ, partial [Actinomycetes bacterium]
ESGVAGDLHSPIHRLDPRAKLIGLAGITLVAVTTPLHAWPAWVACFAALVVVAIVGRVRVATLWRRSRVVLPLVLFVAIFVPFARSGDPVQIGPLTVSEQGLATFAAVSAKAFLGTLSAVLLGATTSFPDVLHALERLRAPKLLVLIAAFMYRYLFVIVDEVSRMRAALASRGYAPRHALQAAAIGRVATALFLRTYERAERVHLAMLARGWRQAMPRLDTLAFTRTDTLFLAALATPLLATRILI